MVVVQGKSFGRRRVQAAFESLESRRLMAASYTYVDLGISDYGSGHTGSGLNRVNNTYLTGSFLDVNFHVRGVRFTGVATNTAAILNPVSGFDSAQAVDASETGVVVGRSYTGTNNIIGTVWSKGKPASLGAGLVNGISPNGKTIVGSVTRTSGILKFQVAHTFGKSGRDIGTLGGLSSTAIDANDSGRIVGHAEDGNGKSVAFLWDGTQMIDIAPAYETGSANAITNNGLVAGDLDNHAFLYNSKNQLLTILPPATVTNPIGTAIALDVNTSGVVVGYTNRTTNPHATVWIDGVGKDLNTIAPIAGYELVYAKSINDKGQIVVLGRDTHFNSRTFLLSPKQAVLGNKGILNINGTPANDVVSVSVKSGKVSVSVNGSVQSFAAANVKKLSIDLGNGNDVLTLAAGTPAASVLGGAGNDTLKVRNSVKDIVDGGLGADKAQLDNSDTKTAIETLLA